MKRKPWPHWPKLVAGLALVQAPVAIGALVDAASVVGPAHTGLLWGVGCVSGFVGFVGFVVSGLAWQL